MYWKKISHFFRYFEKFVIEQFLHFFFQNKNLLYSSHNIILNMRILKITPLISLALSRPDPSPEGGSKPEASPFQLDWWNIAYEKNDPQFQELENFLTSVPENAGHCPPSNWVEDFWDLTMKDRQWKDKDLIKQQLRIWSLPQIKLFIKKINDIETLIKKNSQISSKIVNDFILEKLDLPNN